MEYDALLTLEPEQKSLILNNKGSEHPLYLSYLCENLRQFGDYSLVTKRLKTYPQTIDELLDVLLNEVSATIANQTLVDAFFKLLIAANVGILESDLVQMLEHYLNMNIDDEKNRIIIDRMTWSTIQRYLKLFLDTAWIDGHQLIIFRHSTLQKKLRKRYFEENTNDLISIHKFLANFYLKNSTIKDFSTRRVPYHYEQAQMIKELVTFLRSLDSRAVNQLDRQVYLRKHRCTQIIHSQDGPASQRAYACSTCATLFKLGPYTMTKASCMICTNPILNFNQANNHMKREARVCNKHGTPGYPRTIKCIICRILRVNLTGTAQPFLEPVPMHICFQCAIAGGAATRCCEFNND
ncbi:unnamed protein product [Adineta steineri]|uniref:Uncharacterized protein n=1 Tax=Adineta steineri TaxID=433720 RepID=A0A813YG39_9BILA|nr:unnamed protein product [Adineta steineri]